MECAEEYGIREAKERADKESAENPPSRASLPRGPQRTSLAFSDAMTLKASWPSSLFQHDTSTPEPVAVAAMQENLKLATKVRELERKCRLQEEELVLQKEARRRAEEESTRSKRLLEDQVQDLTSKLKLRPENSLRAPQQQGATATAPTEGGLEDCALPGRSGAFVSASSKGARETALAGHVSAKQMAEALSKVQGELDDARADAETERARANQLTYQLERLRCDTSQELAASLEASSAARAGVAAKAEECRSLRRELAETKMFSEEAARKAQLVAEEAEQRAARLQTRLSKVEATLDGAQHLIASYRQGDVLGTLQSALQTLQSNKETIEALAATAAHAKEEAAISNQQWLQEKEGSRRQVREAEARAQEYVQRAKDEMADLRRDAERAEEAATSRQRLLTVETEQLKDRLRRAQEKLEDADARAVDSERDKVHLSQEAAKDARSRAEDLREEVAALRESHQRQLEALRVDVTRELTGRQQAARRADEAAAEVARLKSSLETLMRSAAMEERELRSAMEAAVRELESSRAASLHSLSQVEERLSRTLVRAEAAEAQADTVSKNLQAVRAGEQALRTQLDDMRVSMGREVASKTQTIESLRDALAASEEMLAHERRAHATAKEEGRWREEALQRQVDAMTAAKERADADAKRVRDAADASVESNGKRIASLEVQAQESASALLQIGREAAAREEENSRLRSSLDNLTADSLATTQKLTAQVAQLKAASESQLKLLDTKELDFAHAQAALKRRVDALEGQGAAEAERTRRMEEEKRRLEDGVAHGSRQIESLREELADLLQTRDSLARQVPKP